MLVTVKLDCLAGNMSIIQSTCTYNFYTPVVLRSGVSWPAVRGHLQVFEHFFAIFAAIRLKLGVLLCSQELLFQFLFRCD
jgi:hypothetical protein